MDENEWRKSSVTPGIVGKIFTKKKKKKTHSALGFQI